MSSSIRESFQHRLAGAFDRQEKGRWERNRRKAWDHFLKLGLPGPKTEAYRTLRMNGLYRQSFVHTEAAAPSAEELAKHHLPNCVGRLVFVNGTLSPALSEIPAGIQVLPFDEALSTYQTFLNNHWQQFLSAENDPFAALNGALHPETTFLYLPPNATLSPIQVLYWNQTPGMVFPRLQVFAGRGSSATFFASSVLGEEVFCNQATDFTLEEGAHVELFSLDPAPNSSWNFSSTRATLKRDAVFSSFLLTEGGASTRHDTRVSLMGENAEANLRGLSLTRESYEAHLQLLVDHQAPQCRSNQQYKTVAFGKSRASFEGKIYVHPIAQKTEAYQLNQNLVIGDRAKVNSKPNLEIFADDVKASHGATIGQVDADQLHYLQSKGLYARDANYLLIHGFAQEMVNMAPLFQERMAAAIASGIDS